MEELRCIEDALNLEIELRQTEPSTNPKVTLQSDENKETIKQNEVAIIVCERLYAALRDARQRVRYLELQSNEVQRIHQEEIKTLRETSETKQEILTAEFRALSLAFQVERSDIESKIKSMEEEKAQMLASDNSSNSKTLTDVEHHSYLLKIRKLKEEVVRRHQACASMKRVCNLALQQSETLDISKNAEFFGEINDYTTDNVMSENGQQAQQRCPFCETTRMRANRQAQELVSALEDELDSLERKYSRNLSQIVNEMQEPLGYGILSPSNNAKIAANQGNDTKQKPPPNVARLVLLMQRKLDTASIQKCVMTWFHNARFSQVCRELQAYVELCLQLQKRIFGAKKELKRLILDHRNFAIETKMLMQEYWNVFQLGLLKFASKVADFQSGFKFSDTKDQNLVTPYRRHSSAAMSQRESEDFMRNSGGGPGQYTVKDGNLVEGFLSLSSPSSSPVPSGDDKGRRRSLGRHKKDKKKMQIESKFASYNPNSRQNVAQRNANLVDFYRRRGPSSPANYKDSAKKSNMDSSENFNNTRIFDGIRSEMNKELIKLVKTVTMAEFDSSNIPHMIFKKSSNTKSHLNKFNHDPESYQSYIIGLES